MRRKAASLSKLRPWKGVIFIISVTLKLEFCVPHIKRLTNEFNRIFSAVRKDQILPLIRKAYLT